jgi:hypothetical protein
MLFTMMVQALTACDEPLVGQGEPKTAGEKPSWPKDYPGQLRSRKWNETVELIGFHPDSKAATNLFGGARHIKPADPDAPGLWDVLWARRLAGSGQFESDSDWIRVFSGPAAQQDTRENSNWTFLALDNDLERRWFEYVQEIWETGNLPPGLVSGVFFGWSDNGRGDIGAYMVELPFRHDIGTAPAMRRVKVGWATLKADAKDSKELTRTRFIPVRGNDFPEKQMSKPEKGTTTIKVRATPGKVRVLIDSVEIAEFTPKADPRGPLGVFINRVHVRFGRGTITALKAP